MRRYWIGLPIVFHACWGQAPSSVGPWAHPDTLQRYLLPDSIYPFLRIQENRLFLAAYLRPLWQLLRDNTRKVRILHIGDSHIQGDIQGREIRNRLYALWGRGGRGYVFPYAIAGTTSAYDYFSLGRGQWLSARSVHWQPALPLGVTGMAVGTYDPLAEWEIQWSPVYQPVTPSEVSLSLLVRTLHAAVSIELQVDTFPPMRRTLPQGYTRVDFALPKLSSKIKGSFRWDAGDTAAYAELHGLFLEEGARGVTWYSMGVNGARLADWATLPLLKESIRLLAPDLIILDLGTNDLYASDVTLAEFRRSVEAAVDTIRAALPDVCLLFTTPQDFYRRMKPLPLLAQASQLIRWLATQKRFGVWDAHTLLGSMREWRLSGLSLPDMVHLTGAGYAIKGQMLAGAFLASYRLFLLDSLPDPAVEMLAVGALPETLLSAPPRPIPLTPSIAQFGGTSPATYAPARPSYMYHRVRSGETLGLIAQRYRTSVSAIQRANGLRGTTIRAGQMLRIPVAGGAGSGPSPSSSRHSSSSRTHVVRSGESLWSIAQRYQVSLEALCRVNGLTPKSAIHPGQRLQIP
ncbi:MAG: LysM peptidoglycan-binding domain-containing protein [Bacteroidia bacterium]|nr:LysM peptidoglycan-binding domain-containing protein [Bacteroidia bacterium]